MAFVISHRQVVADTWQLLKPTAEQTSAPVPSGDVMVPLALWLAQREALLQRGGRLGVWLDSHEDPAAIAADIGHFAVIGVNFPQFGDGRGYSIARLLRERYAYKGELRAIGVVARDHLFAMVNCGFDAFLLQDDQKPEQALAAFDDFSDTYQSTQLQPQPLFRRRLSGAAGK